MSKFEDREFDEDKMSEELENTYLGIVVIAGRNIYLIRQTLSRLSKKDAELLSRLSKKDAEFLRSEVENITYYIREGRSRFSNNTWEEKYNSFRRNGYYASSSSNLTEYMVTPPRGGEKKQQKQEKELKNKEALEDHLEKLDIGEELIIVDPYFLSVSRQKNDTDEEYIKKEDYYVETIYRILKDHISKVKRLVLVTHSRDKKKQDQTKDKIEKKLQEINPGLKIFHKKNENYHDRFWISGGRKKSMVMGTSLNSFGNKVSLLDMLKDEDVEAIVEELKMDKIIS